MVEIAWRVWGTPANFNWFRVLASLLHRRRSIEVNQTLHDIWPSPVLVHYIYIFGGLTPNRILPGAKFTLRPSLAFSYIVSVTERHSNTGCQRTCGVQQRAPIVIYCVVDMRRQRRLGSKAGLTAKPVPSPRVHWPAEPRAREPGKLRDR